MSVTVSPLSPALGAEIGNADIAAGIDDDDFEDIRSAWYRFGLIVLRDQHIDEDQQIAFGRRFGDVAPWSRFADEQEGKNANPYIMLVSNLKENGEYVGSLQEGEIQFHSDGIYTEEPTAATMLYAEQPTEHGGETAYGNMYLAYDRLPDDVKARIDGMKARHAFTYNSLVIADNEQKLATGAKVEEAVHPVVRAHPVTGRKALYVNRLMTREILGMDAEEGRALLAFLYDHLEKPEFIYEHKWRKGDVLLWDNRCLVHARRDFPPSELRIMKRLTIKGERPS
ncbi:MAG: TauD/TfdA family dioxygenase [Alphaproteobacteria bacterium]|nr:TauD/TfdA family dioxygenase [Alphaproteobacteria bacterium]